MSPIGPLEIAVLTGEEVLVPGPTVGSGLLLESAANGTAFLLLENGDFLLLEETELVTTGLLLQSDIGGEVDFLLFEDGDVLLLEG